MFTVCWKCWIIVAKPDGIFSQFHLPLSSFSKKEKKYICQTLQQVTQTEVLLLKIFFCNAYFSPVKMFHSCFVCFSQMKKKVPLRKTESWRWLWTLSWQSFPVTVFKFRSVKLTKVWLKWPSNSYKHSCGVNLFTRNGFIFSNVSFYSNVILVDCFIVDFFFLNAMSIYRKTVVNW